MRSPLDFSLSRLGSRLNSSERWRGWYEKVRDLNSSRRTEIDVAVRFLSDCSSVLDVGCGTGMFLSRVAPRGVGVDLNPDSVEICRRKGLSARVANALSLPFEDNTFDGVYSSHVVHVFHSDQCAIFLKELVRVTKPNGSIVLATIPDTHRAWIHAENARPYPPGAIRGMFRRPQANTESAPTLQGLPTDVRQEAIWFRRPALVDVLGHRSLEAEALCGIVCGLQRSLGLRKWWDFDGYIIKLRNGSKRV